MKIEPRSPHTLAAVFLVLCAGRTESQCAPRAIQQLFPDPGTHVEFGLEVAIAGEWAVVGAGLEDLDAPARVDAGAAYVYRRAGSQWVWHSKLTAPDAVALDHFGIDVDIDGTTIVVGARQHNHGSAYWANLGSAYVFEYEVGQDEWQFATELLGSDVTAGVTEFGSKVAVSGAAIVVASPYDDSCAGADTDCGAVYVYVEPSSGWSAAPVLLESAKLVSAQAEDGAHFGSDVRIDGRTVAVGAHREDVDGVFDCGAAYVFEEPSGGWTGSPAPSTRIVPEVPQAESGFGGRVDVQEAPSGGRIVIGAHRVPWLGIRYAAFAVEEPPSGWSSLPSLPAAPNLVSRHLTTQDNFGVGLAIDGDRVVVGAATDDPPGRTDVGRAYVFVRLSNGVWFEEQWLQAKLPSSTGQYSPYLGGAVALQGDTVLVGAHVDDNAAGPDAGTVLVYELRPCHLRQR